MNGNFGFTSREEMDNTHGVWQAENAFTPLFVGDYVKIGFPIPCERPGGDWSKEFMWVQITATHKIGPPGAGPFYVGELRNEPVFAKHLSENDEIGFTRDEITGLMSAYRTLTELVEQSVPYLEKLE